MSSSETISNQNRGFTLLKVASVSILCAVFTLIVLAFFTEETRIDVVDSPSKQCKEIVVETEDIQLRTKKGGASTEANDELELKATKVDGLKANDELELKAKDELELKGSSSRYPKVKAFVSRLDSLGGTLCFAILLLCCQFLALDYYFFPDTNVVVQGVNNFLGYLGKEMVMDSAVPEEANTNLYSYLRLSLQDVSFRNLENLGISISGEKLLDYVYHPCTFRLFAPTCLLGNCLLVVLCKRVFKCCELREDEAEEIEDEIEMSNPEYDYSFCCNVWGLCGWIVSFGGLCVLVECSDGLDSDDGQGPKGWHRTVMKADENLWNPIYFGSDYISSILDYHYVLTARAGTCLWLTCQLPGACISIWSTCLRQSHKKATKQTIRQKLFKTWLPNMISFIKSCFLILATIGLLVTLYYPLSLTGKRQDPTAERVPLPCPNSYPDACHADSAKLHMLAMLAYMCISCLESVCFQRHISSFVTGLQSIISATLIFSLYMLKDWENIEFEWLSALCIAAFFFLEHGNKICSKICSC